ncbi:Peregrin [Fasciola gigantica]|uniref:Peregrin n=1 Tax=Fasciola gigantica TaxID=46835 RepID=A0A504YT24_FASGI|nr:Peregrin [Fasciola gigantica]
MVYHPVDFDIDDFLSRIQGNKPPFMCPAETCGKIYKSYAHMQKHMLIHRPPAPIEIPAPQVECSQNGNVLTANGSSSVQSCFILQCTANNKNLQTQKPMNLLAPTDSRCSVVFEATPKQRPERRVNLSKNKSRHSLQKAHNSDEKLPNNIGLNNSSSIDLVQPDEKKTEFQLPKPVFEIDANFSFRKPVPLREGVGYIRFIEKSPDELDDIVEYDLDEEDIFWLDRINKERRTKSLSSISETVLEWVIDRFEKEARFRVVAANGALVTGNTCATPGLSQSGVDEDAVCAVCQDGTCENTNVILFCDVCNLAVHQVSCEGLLHYDKNE